MSFHDYPLTGVLGPHVHDVLCGRGGGTNNHVGNNHWRALVTANKQLYITLPKRQKMLLSKSIVNAVRSQHPPGRFLQKDSKLSTWFDVGDQKATEKTSQALREGAPTLIRTKKETDDGTSTENPVKSTQKKPKIKKEKKKKEVSLVPPIPPRSNNQQPVSQDQPKLICSMPPPPLKQSCSPGMVKHSPGSQVLTPYGYATHAQQTSLTQVGPLATSSTTKGPAVPAPVASHAPENVNSGRRKRMPKKTNSPAEQKQSEEVAKAAPTSIALQHYHQNAVACHQPYQTHQMLPPAMQLPIQNFERAAAAAVLAGATFGANEFSFGSISMTSAEHGLLQPTGTSFGSNYGMYSNNNFEPDPIRHPPTQHLQEQHRQQIQSSATGMHAPLWRGVQPSKTDLLSPSDSDSESDDVRSTEVTRRQSSEEYEKMKAKLSLNTKGNGLSKVKTESNATPVVSINVLPQPHGNAAIPPDFIRDLSCMSALSTMSFEPTNSRSTSRVMASMGGGCDGVYVGGTGTTELNRDVSNASNAFSEMSVSRDGSDTIGTIDKKWESENMGPPLPLTASPNSAKQELSEQEKLEMLMLTRGASLAYDSFGHR